MMERRQFETLADYYRAHRATLELAREMGCTPREAESELRRRDRLARRAARDAQQDCGTRSDFSDWNSPWMMRN